MSGDQSKPVDPQTTDVAVLEATRRRPCTFGDLHTATKLETAELIAALDRLVIRRALLCIEGEREEWYLVGRVQSPNRRRRAELSRGKAWA